MVKSFYKLGYEKMKDDGKVKIAVMANDIIYIRQSIDKIYKKLEHEYVTRNEFRPVKLIAYGLIGVISSTVVGYLLVKMVNGGS